MTREETMNMYWHPGQTIPLSAESPTPEEASASASSKMMDILQGFQSSMEKQLTSINGKLEGINGRIDKVEGRQVVLEKEIKGSTLKCDSSTSGHSRRRITPTSLQV